MSVQKRSHIFVGWVCAGVVFFFAIHQARVHTPTFFDRAFSSILYPFLTTQRIVIAPFVALSSWIKTSHQLHTDIHNLQKELDFFKNQAVALAGTYQFEKDTDEVRAYKCQYEGHQATLARVLTKKMDDTEHSMCIQGGSSKGFAVNMPVMYKNCIVGRIAQVFPYYSKVILITDPTCKIGARCLHSQAQGIFQGIKELDRATLTHVTHLATLEEGDLVLSSGEGVVFPHGFGLGRVTSFAKEDLFYNVILEPLVDVSRLTYCYVLNPVVAEKKTTVLLPKSLS